MNACLLIVSLLDLTTTNLVANPGFEVLAEGEPAHWLFSGFSEGGRATWSVSMNRPRSGKYCVRVHGDAEWAALQSAPISIKPGQTYRLRAYVRAARGHGYVKFDYFRGTQYLGMTSDEYVTRNEWTELTFTAETENYPRATHLRATLIGGDGVFDVCFDDVSITAK